MDLERGLASLLPRADASHDVKNRGGRDHPGSLRVRLVTRVDKNLAHPTQRGFMRTPDSASERRPRFVASVLSRTGPLALHDGRQLTQRSTRQRAPQTMCHRRRRCDGTAGRSRCSVYEAGMSAASTPTCRSRSTAQYSPRRASVMGHRAHRPPERPPERRSSCSNSSIRSMLPR
jgi:hypothetical protein